MDMEVEIPKSRLTVSANKPVTIAESMVGTHTTKFCQASAWMTGILYLETSFRHKCVP